MADPLDRLPAGTRQPEHGRAVDAAERAVREAGLDEPLEAARSAIGEFVTRAYGAAQFRVSRVGMNSAPGLGPTDDRVRVVRTLEVAVTAVVAWDALDEADRAEVLGRWGELVR